MRAPKLLPLFLLLTVFTSCQGQERGKQLLTIGNEITLPHVRGRIDHMDINLKDRIVYLAALGNNTLEIVDLKIGKVTGSISGLNEPQGVAYIQRHQELFIANGGTGECDFYNALTLKKTGTIKLTGDADDVRYDAGKDRIYVGYGGGGIAFIDAATHKQMGDIALPSHPESFQLDPATDNLWVNLPGSGLIGICNLKQVKMTSTWSKLLPRANFPMAYDKDQHRIIVGYRVPARLIVYDSQTGEELFRAPMVGDVDDLYWNPTNKSIYISGGGGLINIFRQTADRYYKQIGNIRTSKGARTSLLVPELKLFLVASRAAGDQNATLRVYNIMQ